MKPVTVHAAKTNLSKLIERACAGEEVIIARGATPVVRLVPVHATSPKRVFGTLRRRLSVPPEFFEPLPAGELAEWERWATMRVLLDTHTLLWWLAGDKLLSRRARKVIGDEATTVYVSAASAWEIATKVRPGKLPNADYLVTNSVRMSRHRDSPLSMSLSVMDCARALSQALTRIPSIACSSHKHKPRISRSFRTKGYSTHTESLGSGKDTSWPNRTA